MKEAIRKEQMGLLIQALLSLESEEECEQLLSDLCTIREMQDLAQRNLPVIGDFLAEIVNVVQRRLE